MKAKFFLSLPQLLSFRGRISRLQYFVYSLIYVAVFFAIVATCSMLNLIAVNSDGNPTGTPLQLALYSFIMLAFGIMLWAQIAKRAHDLNLPAILGVIMIIDLPVDLMVSLLKNAMSIPHALSTTQTAVDGIAKLGSIGLGVFLTFRAGDKGANKYGPDPLKDPTPVDVF